MGHDIKIMINGYVIKIKHDKYEQITRYCNITVNKATIEFDTIIDAVKILIIA
jgi:hypothetical protein